MEKIAIIGTGNLGSSIAEGLLKSNYCKPEQLILTRRTISKLKKFKALGCETSIDNKHAVLSAQTIIFAVEPHHAPDVIQDIESELSLKKPHFISVVTGLSIATLKKATTLDNEIVRAMPNTAISIQESMTCLSGQSDSASLKKANEIFSQLGEVVQIGEEHMSSATALAACGIAFFLRAIRAASQGGIQIGFHSDIALKIASQTAKGAASLLIESDNHPEQEIDRVTTPMGCTIAGLNQMEHEGFSSALIKGIVTSAGKASEL